LPRSGRAESGSAGRESSGPVAGIEAVFVDTGLDAQPEQSSAAPTTRSGRRRCKAAARIASC
ncbi:MAG: hypothetical protein ACE5G3_05840, partial [Gammaproteobacteria bacterium]